MKTMGSHVRAHVSTASREKASTGFIPGRIGAMETSA